MSRDANAIFVIPPAASAIASAPSQGPIGHEDLDQLRATLESMSGLAHDFGGFLMSTQAGLDLVEAEVSPEGKRVLALVQEAVESAGALARRMARLAKVGDAADAEIVALDELITRLVPRLRQMFPRVEIRVETPRGGVQIHADRLHLEQIVFNLVQNAAQACKMRGIVSLRVWARHGRAYLSIADNGCGIAPGQLAKVFEPYFSTRGSEGTGLGLAVVNRLVHEQHGEIKVVSEVGAGTTFTLDWPIPRLSGARHARRRSMGRRGAA